MNKPEKPGHTWIAVHIAPPVYEVQLGLAPREGYDGYECANCHEIATKIPTGTECIGMYQRDVNEMMRAADQSDPSR